MFRGLEGVVDYASVAIILLQLDNMFEERYAQKRRLAALPGKAHVFTWLRPDILANICIENIIGHAKVATAFRVKVLLLEVIAVSAVEVANRPMGFGHDMN